MRCVPSPTSHIVVILAVVSFAQAMHVHGQTHDTGSFTEVQQRAKTGDAAAEYELGLRYSAGHDISADEKQALKWYRKAAEQGLLAAQKAVMIAYRDGKGVKPKGKEAAEWGEKCAKQGDRECMETLRALYSKDGYGEHPDPEKAVYWSKKICALFGGDMYTGSTLAKLEAENGLPVDFVLDPNDPVRNKELVLSALQDALKWEKEWYEKSQADATDTRRRIAEGDIHAAPLDLEESYVAKYKRGVNGVTAKLQELDPSNTEVAANLPQTTYVPAEHRDGGVLNGLNTVLGVASGVLQQQANVAQQRAAEAQRQADERMAQGRRESAAHEASEERRRQQELEAQQRNTTVASGNSSSTENCVVDGSVPSISLDPGKAALAKAAPRKNCTSTTPSGGDSSSSSNQNQRSSVSSSALRSDSSASSSGQTNSLQEYARLEMAKRSSQSTAVSAGITNADSKPASTVASAGGTVQCGSNGWIMVQTGDVSVGHQCIAGRWYNVLSSGELSLIAQNPVPLPPNPISASNTGGSSGNGGSTGSGGNSDISPIQTTCISMDFNANYHWDQYFNHCGQSVNLTLFWQNGRQGYIEPLRTDKPQGTARSQAEYTANGGTPHLYACPVGYYAVDTSGTGLKSLKSPPGSYRCRKEH